MFSSVVVKFWSNENIYFNNSPGHALHGLIFKFMREIDEESATHLHDSYDRKPFTLSSISPFPKPIGKNRYLLTKAKEYEFRLTFLEDKWYQQFLNGFLLNNDLRLCGKRIEVAEVITNKEGNEKCKVKSVEDIFNEVKCKRKIKLYFASTTSFTEQKSNKQLIFPEPILVFKSLLNSWRQWTDRKLTINEEDFEHIYVSQYNLRSSMESLGRVSIKGFKGECEYALFDGLSDIKVIELNALADFAEFCGIGQRTAMGLGQAWKLDR